MTSQAKRERSIGLQSLRQRVGIAPASAPACTPAALDDAVMPQARPTPVPPPQTGVTTATVHVSSIDRPTGPAPLPPGKGVVAGQTPADAVNEPAPLPPTVTSERPVGPGLMPHMKLAVPTPVPPTTPVDDAMTDEGIMDLAVIPAANERVTLHNLTAPEGLPEGWLAVAMSDGSGDYYYWCPDTQEVSWQRPTREQASHRAQPSQRLHETWLSEDVSRGWLHLSSTAESLNVDVGAEPPPPTSQPTPAGEAPKKTECIWAPRPARAATSARGGSPRVVLLASPRRSAAGGASPRVVVPPSPPPMPDRILMWERRRDEFNELEWEWREKRRSKWEQTAGDEWDWRQLKLRHLEEDEETASLQATAQGLLSAGDRKSVV